MSTLYMYVVKFDSRNIGGSFTMKCYAFATLDKARNKFNELKEQILEDSKTRVDDCLFGLSTIDLTKDSTIVLDCFGCGRTKVTLEKAEFQW